MALVKEIVEGWTGRLSFQLYEDGAAILNDISESSKIEARKVAALIAIEELRAKRDELLAQSDALVVPDRWAAYTDEKRTALTKYRQALREQSFPYRRCCQRWASCQLIEEQLLLIGCTPMSGNRRSQVIGSLCRQRRQRPRSSRARQFTCATAFSAYGMIGTHTFPCNTRTEDWVRLNSSVTARSGFSWL